MPRGQGGWGTHSSFKRTFAELSQFSLILLAGLVCGKVPVREVLGVLLAFVFHTLSQALTKEFSISGLAALFLQTSFEFLDALFRSPQAFLESLGLQYNLILRLLRVPKSTPGYLTRSVTLQDPCGVCANRVILHEQT